MPSKNESNWAKIDTSQDREWKPSSRSWGEIPSVREMAGKEEQTDEKEGSRPDSKGKK